MEVEYTALIISLPVGGKREKVLRMIPRVETHHWKTGRVIDRRKHVKKEALWGVKTI